METTHPADEASLRRELRRARARLDELVDSLRAVDAELEGLATLRGRHDLLAKACDALQELEGQGGGELFWRGAPIDRPEDHLRLVRSRLDEFEKQLALVEERRQMLLEEIDQQQDAADLFAGHILDAERIAEERQAEWLVERELQGPAVRPALMPWSRSQEDDRRFRRTLLAVAGFCAFLGWLLPRIDIPIPDRWEILEEQERLTQLVREEVPPPLAAIEPELVEPIAPNEESPTPSESEEGAPELADTTQPESDPAPAPRPNTGTDAGPGRGAGARGLLAFREQFAGVDSTDDAVARLGANARIHDPTAVADGRPERSMVTSQAPGSSGGINVAALSRGTGGGNGSQLSGVAVTRATSSLGTGNGNGTGNGKGRGGSGTGTGSGASAGRTDEEIQIVFDRHKAALYRLYNRELRQNPTLRGQIVLRLTIQPDGSVSFCEVKSTDMKAPELARQVVERVKSFDFGAKAGIPAVTIVYPIDFLPAT